MGRVGLWFESAVAVAFFSSPEREVLSRHKLTDRRAARVVAIDWW